MSLLTTRAVILQTYRYSDTSKVLRLMTRDLGPCSCIARGALRPKSRFGGLLEPFIEGDATLYVREGRDLYTLSGFELVRQRRRLANSLPLFGLACVLCELVMRLAPEQTDHGLYSSLVNGLDGLYHLCANQQPGGFEYVWALIAEMGFRPQLEDCLDCGRDVAGEAAYFDAAMGRIRCTACTPFGDRLEAEELDTFRQLVAGQSPLGNSATREGKRHGTWLSGFVRHHLAEGIQIRSLSYLESANGAFR